MTGTRMNGRVGSFLLLCAFALLGSAELSAQTTTG
jgi:hypothetical protein